VKLLAHVDRDAVHERLLSIDAVAEAEIEAHVRREAAGPESMTAILGMDSGPRLPARPGMTM